MARLWMPRISPRCRHKFHGGVFHRERNIWDTGGVGCSAALAAAATRPLRGRRVSQATDRQTEGHRVKHPCLGGLTL